MVARARTDQARRNPGVHFVRVMYPAKGREYRFLARWVSQFLTYRMPVLLWITESGIWPSSENWHLYYKLRQSYADHRLLDEAPGQLFLDYQTEDLATLLQIALLNGWGGYLLTHANYVNAFFSHDEYIDFFAREESSLAELRSALGTGAPAYGATV